MSALVKGWKAGTLSALYGNPAPSAVSIPSAYLGGDLPKAWDGWTEAAHVYADAYGRGHALVVASGEHGSLRGAGVAR